MNARDDIEDILREDPIENRSKIQTPNKAKKPNVFSKLKLNKKKVMIGAGIIAIIIAGFLLMPGSCECEVCDECIQKISIENIKQQIVSQGYAEINDGDKVLKLSPCTD